jgi:hypothetical protein
VRYLMTWVRSNIKCGSWIALFALVVQFALSFGHFHPIASAAASAPEVGSALSGLSVASRLSGQVAEVSSKRQRGIVRVAASIAVAAGHRALASGHQGRISSRRVRSHRVSAARPSDLLTSIDCSPGIAARSLG